MIALLLLSRLFDPACLALGLGVQLFIRKWWGPPVIAIIGASVLHAVVSSVDPHAGFADWLASVVAICAQASICQGFITSRRKPPAPPPTT